jgi:glyoxylate utilization-related uncharacterized protein
MSVPQTKLSAVIDVRTAGSASASAPSSGCGEDRDAGSLAADPPNGREIPTHLARGEITVHCLEGRIAFAADGTTRELEAGQMLVLAAGEPHSVVGLEDSAVLVTKILPANPPSS